MIFYVIIMLLFSRTVLCSQPLLDKDLVKDTLALALSVSSHLTKQREKDKKIVAAQDQLWARDVTWEEKKQIIKKVVEEEGVHPDSLHLNTKWASPLHCAVLRNDLDFTRFLLKHEANPNHRSMRWGEYPIECAQTVAMAQMLLDHGAASSLNTMYGESVLIEPKDYTRGVRILCERLSTEAYEPGLITLYVSYGVDPNGYSEGATPLLHLAINSNTNDGASDSLILRTQNLMAAGALLEKTFLRSHNSLNHTIAQMLKTKLEGHLYLASEQRQGFQAMRQVLIDASKYRRVGLKENLNIYFLPELSALINDYYIKPEKSYEELEAEALPI